ncbi:MAG: oligosaccharide flippase family protein [Bacteroidaceae bacterium]|nr:oligosaccharide flippase family protein [Bacteroidaceae bacterium]
MEKTTNKTIAKNTIFLYFRMALVTVVGLYTSRVVLQYLGVDDFGIYNIAGSVVALFSFLTGALGNSSSRFITVEIGKVKDGDNSHLVDCFKTTRTIHALLATGIFLIAETIGLWILYTQCNIPADRMTTAMWVYQISVATSMLNVTQIPFTALIIAHERMGIYAYVSIFEVIAKLLICYLLIVSPMDKLIFYAALLFGVQILTLSYYRLYCKRMFDECKMGYTISKEFFRPLMSFSFWNLFGSLSYSALTQGTTIIISMFFTPAVVTARAVANQVKNHVINFVTNFRMAINPQILKRHSAGDKESSKELLFLSCNISFYLMLVMVLPLMFEARFVLELWLHEVPDYTVEFLQIVLLEMLFYVYDVTFYQIFQAEGRLKENAIICPLMDFVVLSIIYFIYQSGGNVLWIAWGMLFLTIMQGMVVKPILAIRMFGYSWGEFVKVFKNNVIVFVTSAIIPFVIVYTTNIDDDVIPNLSIIILCVFTVCIASYLFGLSKKDRERVNKLISNRIKK